LAEVAAVRGEQDPQARMSAFIDVETLIPHAHPLRTVKPLADAALAKLSPTLDAMYVQAGRPSIPPERLLKASLLMSVYSVRSERAFCEELAYHLLFRWFLGMNLVEPPFDHSTLGADKNYDTRDCVADLRQRHVTPHVAQNMSGRRIAIDGRTTRHASYDTSQRIRKRVEEIFGWMKTVGGFRRTRYLGLERTQLAGYLVAAAYNLVRMARLLARPTWA
jgi:hypothetical protein